MTVETQVQPEILPEAIEEEARALYEDYRAQKPRAVDGVLIPLWQDNAMDSVKDAWRATARGTLLRAARRANAAFLGSGELFIATLASTFKRSVANEALPPEEYCRRAADVVAFLLGKGDAGQPEREQLAAAIGRLVDGGSGG
jgi:hypothetical protein